MIKLYVEDNEAHRVVIPDFSIFLSFYEIFGENPLFLAFSTVFGVLFAVHQKLGRCDSKMKCRGRWDASMVEISIPQLFSNYRIFGENHPFLGETFTLPIGLWMVRWLVRFFHRFFVNISAILRAVEFVFGALRSGSLAGQLGVKIILPPQFWCTPTFLPLRFCKFFQRILITHMRFTIQVCFQIHCSYENKGALGGKSPPGHNH